eukprot:TRINITY_DN1653_c0_g1_i1.p1 TRINITY_DN1653_c0_g1~~TRINITY_DN1653_c0_g1_i1.p1  ORF type:complete len:209 (-),score=29.77 TRINITY_DN1653_c0_g1_i1:45-671(-)
MAESQEFQYLCVLDFEATCAKGTQIKPQEIIEFPVVLLDTASLTVVDEFHQYVTPLEHPILTDFCKELTGIQQEWVDAGVPLEKCLELFHNWLLKNKLLATADSPNPPKWAFVTCGDWDLDSMLLRQCKHFKINRPPYFKSWVNIKRMFEATEGVTGMGMAGMLRHLRMELIGRHHSGIDDARNIARLAVALMRKGCRFTITKQHGGA